MLGCRASWVLVLAYVAACLSACAARGPARAEAPTAPLQSLALDALGHHGCEALLGRVLSLEGGEARSSGRVWIRKCTADRAPGSVHASASAVGWQWVDTQTGGFDVREYVYFTATIDVVVTAVVEAEGGAPIVRIRPIAPAKVDVRDIGRVSARPVSPATTLLGIAGGLFGYGSNALATNAMRGRVEELVKERLSLGARQSLRALLGGDTEPAPWLEEVQVLHEGGALLSGPFEPDQASELRFDIAAGSDGVLARQVCQDEAASVVDAIVAGAPPRLPPPRDVRTLRGRGTVALGAMRCPWILVTAGVAPKAEGVVATLALGPAARSGERLAHATLIDFEIAKTDLGGASWDPNDNAPDVSFSVEARGAVLRFGPAVPDAWKATLWLDSADFLVRDGDRLLLRAVDLDPVRGGVLDPLRFDEQPVGTASVTVAELTRGDGQRVELVRDGHVVGSARLRLAWRAVE